MDRPRASQRTGMKVHGEEQNTGDIAEQPVCRMVPPSPEKGTITTLTGIGSDCATPNKPKVGWKYEGYDFDTQAHSGASVSGRSLKARQPAIQQQGSQQRESNHRWRGERGDEGEDAGRRAGWMRAWCSARRPLPTR